MNTRRIALAAVFALAAVQPAWAQAPAEAAPTGPLEIIRASDTGLTCPQIAEEAADLSQTMGGEPGGGLFGVLGGVAAAGAAMVIPGAGLVTAAAEALTQPERDRREAETLAVKHRWYYLNGLYAGQKCMAAADAAGPTPASPADADPAPNED